MKIKWYISIISVLIITSAVFYLIQVNLFHKIDDTIFYMLQDISFVPIQVLFVTLILDRLLKKRDKDSLLNKLNMVIGVFFNDIGNQMLDFLGNFLIDFNNKRRMLNISASWQEKDYRIKIKEFNINPDDIVIKSGDLASLNNYLMSKSQGLLNMLSNPNLLEHETFTNLLWAVFHVSDELRHRTDFDNLPLPDINHLKGDIIRAYKLLIIEWLSYMKHLKKNYPYLYSIAIRTNPFNPDANIIIC